MKTNEGGKEFAICMTISKDFRAECQVLKAKIWGLSFKFVLPLSLVLLEGTPLELGIMDSSTGNLSDDDDSEYEEDGCHDQMWDKMNDVLQEVNFQIH